MYYQSTAYCQLTCRSISTAPEWWQLAMHRRYTAQQHRDAGGRPLELQSRRVSMRCVIPHGYICIPGWTPCLRQQYLLLMFRAARKTHTFKEQGAHHMCCICCCWGRVFSSHQLGRMWPWTDSMQITAIIHQHSQPEPQSQRHDSTLLLSSTDRQRAVTRTRQGHRC